MDSIYDNADKISKMVKEGKHRKAIGDMWEEIGNLQLDFLKNNGLKPSHFLLDVGCGSLRGGVRFIEYLESGHYFGIDINQSLLDSGYEVELKTVPGLTEKLPRTNLACVADFDASGFGQKFDFAIAQSVFSHLTFNRIRLCFENLQAVIAGGGKFFATYFHLPDDQPSGPPLVHSPGGITTTGCANPYHYRVDDFQHAIKRLPWVLEDAVEWNHPRAQRMLIFTRT